MRWQSDKRVGSEEAFLWARHFEVMEKEMDISRFGFSERRRNRSANGPRRALCHRPQVVAAVLAELLEL